MAGRAGSATAPSPGHRVVARADGAIGGRSFPVCRHLDRCHQQEHRATPFVRRGVRIERGIGRCSGRRTQDRRTCSPSSHRVVSFSSIRRLRSSASGVSAAVERLVLGEAAGGDPVGRDALLDQVFRDRDGARGGQLPVRGEARAADRDRGRCARRPAAPRGSRAGSRPAISFSAPAILARLSRPSAWIRSEPLAKMTSDWNTNRSPTTRTSSRLPSRRSQLAEELRAVAGQLLDLGPPAPC